ncbi:MAG: hypothetical protein R3F34_03805 [Planctomycetota bacterium]
MEPVAMLSGPFAIVAVILGSIFGFVLLIWIVGALLKGIGWVLETTGRFITHVFGCIKGVVVEAVRAAGALVSALILFPMALMNLAFGRWAASKHFADSAGDELRAMVGSTYRAAIGWPLRLVGLGFALDNLEARMLETVERAPRVEPGALDFWGYTIEKRLPQGGSGAQLFLARPTDEHRTRLASQGIDLPSRVVVKAFGLDLGSSLPQMMRENRALEAARRMGLVFEHVSEGERFYYVMPYVPGDDLGVVVHRLHERSGAQGLDDASLSAVLAHTQNLLGILGRFHAAGVWHKDIKPSNIVVNGDRVELIDLGLVTPLASAMTLTTHGTEYYRDPELVRQAMKGVKVHEVDGVKFDLYSVGAVVYSMVEDSFPAHGNLSRITRRCPQALSWVVRRAMAESSQRYASTSEMLADVAKIAQAHDPFAVRPADLPSMGGSPVELPQIPDQPLPPLRRTGPPPLPHERARDERAQTHRRHHEERLAARRRRQEARDSARRVAHEAARRHREEHRSGSRPMHMIAGAIGIMAGFAFLGAMALALVAERHVSSFDDGPTAEAYASPQPFEEPSSFDVNSTASAPMAMPAPVDGPVDPAGHPVVLLLPEVPRELLDADERARLHDVAATLESSFGWWVVSEFDARDVEGVDEEAVLAGARAEALMNEVGEERSRERLQAFLEISSEIDGVLWIGFDDQHRIARHELVVPDEDRGLERKRVTKRTFQRMLDTTLQ